MAITRILESVLAQVSPSDPATFAAAAPVLSAAAVFGCLVPARRAMRVDPVVALYRECRGLVPAPETLDMLG